MLGFRGVGIHVVAIAAIGSGMLAAGHAYRSAGNAGEAGVVQAVAEAGVREAETRAYR
jgi:hypothetical protein